MKWEFFFLVNLTFLSFHHRSDMPNEIILLLGYMAQNRIKLHVIKSSGNPTLIPYHKKMDGWLYWKKSGLNKPANHSDSKYFGYMSIDHKGIKTLLWRDSVNQKGWAKTMACINIQGYCNLQEKKLILSNICIMIFSSLLLIRQKQTAEVAFLDCKWRFLNAWMMHLH